MESDQAIRERAYQLWEKEGSPHGRDKEFWERARLMVAADAKPAMATPLQARSAEEATVDEAMKETFPASDPPSYNAEAAPVSAEPAKPKAKGRAKTKK